MKASHIVFGLSAALFCQVATASLGQADVLDLGTVKCKDFLNSSKEEIGYTLAWLDGYYKDEDDPPVIDTTKFVANAKKLGDYCAAHPDDGLITATDKLFQKE